MSAKNNDFPLKSKRKFINLSKVSKHLYCSICQNIFSEPTRITCGHTFCLDCITHWAKKHSDCPICRSFFSQKSMQRDLVGFNMVNELEVYCNNNGCPWKSSLQNLNEHLKHCYFDPNKIPDFIKNIVCKTAESNQKRNKELGVIEEEYTSNNNINFNTKVSLKARLYNKNKLLMERVLSKKKEIPKRDTIFELLTKE